MTNAFSRTTASSEKAPLKAWLIWVCGALFYGYQFILRTSPAVITDELMAAFSVEGFGLGLLTAYYYYAYSAMQIPAGIMLDRFGPRYLVAGAISIASLGACLFGYAESLLMASIGRGLMGLGSAFAYIGTLKIATQWFPIHQVGRVIGATMVFGTLGAWLGGSPFRLLTEFIGWRSSMFILVVMGLSLSFTFWLVVRNKKETINPDMDIQDMPDDQEGKPLWSRGLTLVVSKKQVWMIATFAGLMYVPLSAFADLWGTPFFKTLYQIERSYAASITSMIYIGVAVGSPIMTYLSDVYQDRTRFMRYSALCSFFLYMTIIYVPSIPIPLMYVLMFLAGISFTGQVLSFVLVTQSLPLYASAVSVGLTNMVVMSSGVIFEPLVGKLLAWSAGTPQEGCIPYYDINDFYFALAVVPLSLLVAYVLVFCIKNCQRSQERS